MMFRSQHITALTLLILLGFIWGTGYSIAHFVTTNGVTPLAYTFWQTIGPAICVFGMACLMRQTVPFSAPYLRYYFICSITGIIIPNTNMYFAAAHLPAGILAVLVNTVPILAYPLALFFQVETFNRMRFLGVLFAMVGILLILIPETGLPSRDMLPWALMTLITPVSFAFCAVYISKHRPPDTHSLSLAAGTLIVSTFLFTPLILAIEPLSALRPTFTVTDWIILLEIILSSIGYVVFFQLVKIAGPVYYSLVDTLVCLTGLGWGYIIFHEKLNTWTTPAVLFILLALLLVTHHQRQQNRFLSR